MVHKAREGCVYQETAGLLILTLVDIMVTLLCSSTESRNVTLCRLGSQRGGIYPPPSDGDEANKINNEQRWNLRKGKLQVAKRWHLPSSIWCNIVGLWVDWTDGIGVGSPGEVRCRLTIPHILGVSWIRQGGNENWRSKLGSCQNWREQNLVRKQELY